MICVLPWFLLWGMIVILTKWDLCMGRIAVDDESIRMFVASPPVVDYFSDLITFLRQQSFSLDALVDEVSK